MDWTKTNPTMSTARACLVASAAAAAAACSTTAWGPNGCVFASHMVLASSDAWRGGVTPARVWGNAAPGESILLTGLPSGATVAPSNPWTADASGTWSITVSAVASLTPSTLSFQGKSSTVNLTDVLFGHTFLCAGQSNMDMNVGCTFSVNETNVQALQYPEIRMMNQGANGNWASAANPNSSVFLDDFSATCYYTALWLKTTVPAFANVPIGLVRSSVGGQCIERFESSAALESVGVPAVNATGISCGQNSTTLYNSLIVPLAPFVFKAMIWYQGECNVGCNVQTVPSWLTGYYARLLPELITSWRALFAVDFSALVVQLAAYGSADELPQQRSGDGLPALRAAQMSALTVPGAGLAFAHDLGDDGWSRWTPATCGFHGGIHPRNKTEVGRRLALRLAQIEGVLPAGAQPDGPALTAAAAPAGGPVTLTFDSATAGGLVLAPTQDCRTQGRVPPPYNATTAGCCQTTVGSAPFGYPFELRLEDGATFVLAQATVSPASNSVALLPVNASIAGPFTAVRYAWQGFPLCVLANGAGMPTPQFLHVL